MEQGVGLYLVILGTIAAVISAVCDVLGVLSARRGQTVEHDQSLPSRRTYVVMVVFLLLTWGAVAFDYYDRHHSETCGPGLSSIVFPPQDYGVQPPNLVYAAVDTDRFASDAAEHYLMLAIRVTDNQVEPFFDRRLEKSSGFRVSGGIVRIEMQMSPSFLARLGTKKDLEYYVLLVPSAVRVAQIQVLADVIRLGGRLVATGNSTVPIEKHVSTEGRS